MIASIKSICIKGRFVNMNLMQPEDHVPKHSFRGVIDRNLANAKPTAVVPAHDVVAI